MVLDLEGYSRYLEERLIEEQHHDGHWVDSVTITADALVALSNYGSSQRVTKILRPGIDWILKKQGPNGAWGRYRGRTRKEDATRETHFDPNWPHTIQALWAQFELGVVGIPCMRGLEWIRDRFISERDNLSFDSEVDLLTLVGLAKNSSHPEYEKLLNQIPLPKWRELETQIINRMSYSGIELESLYRYNKYLLSIRSQLYRNYDSNSISVRKTIDNMPRLALHMGS